jgi:hypothetical protein
MPLPLSSPPSPLAAMLYPHFRAWDAMIWFVPLLSDPGGVVGV